MGQELIAWQTNHDLSFLSIIQDITHVLRATLIIIHSIVPSPKRSIVMFCSVAFKDVEIIDQTLQSYISSMSRLLYDLKVSTLGKALMKRKDSSCFSR